MKAMMVSYTMNPLFQTDDYTPTDVLKYAYNDKNIQVKQTST